MKYLFIVIIIILIFLSFFQYNSIEFYTNSQIDSKISNLQNEINNISDVNLKCPGPVELPCNEGPRGPPGKTGGIYSNHGPLRNLGNTNQFIDRLFGSGSAAVPFLSKQNFKPQQTWTLESDTKKLRNQFGNCLFGDINTNVVYMGNCNSSDAGIQWIYDNYGRLKLKSDENKCLTPQYEGIIKDIEKKDNLNLKKSNLNQYSKFMQIKLDKCENINSNKLADQQWSFY